MGGRQSHDIDKTRVQEITKAVTEQFLFDFKLWYKEILNEKVKSQAIWKEGKLSFLQAPIPHRPLKKGFVYKLGYNVKSWKRRYLVAFNQRDNYVLRYFEDTTLVKCKGSIDCCGYSVKTFLAEEDEHNYGIYGIQLVPNDEQKRVWNFRVESTKEQDEWIQIFLNAGKKTSPDPGRDVYYYTAFAKALVSTNATYGYYGSLDLVNPEIDLLTQLTKRILRREYIDEYIQMYHQRNQGQSPSLKRSSSRTVSVNHGDGYRGVPPSSTPLGFVATSSTQQESIILISQINDIVNSVISPIIQSTRKKTLAFVAETQSQYEEAVRPTLQRLLKAEKSVYDFLLRKLKSLIDPTLNDLQQKIFEPIMEKMFERFLASYVSLFSNFTYQLVEKTSCFESYLDTLRGIERLDNLIDTIDESTNNCLLESYDILWKLMTKELIDCGEIFEGCDIQPFSVIYINTTEDMRQCIHNALFTFKCLLKGCYDEEKRIQHQSLCSYSFWMKTKAPLTAESNSAVNRAAGAKKSSSSQRSPSPVPDASVTNSGKKAHKSEASQPSTADIITKLELLFSFLEHDLYELMTSRLVDILSEMVEITIQESILMPGQEIFNSARGMERDLAPFLHLNCLGERIVRDCVKAYISHFLTASTTSYGQQIKSELRSCHQEAWNTIKACPSLHFLHNHSNNENVGLISPDAISSESITLHEK